MAHGRTSRVAGVTEMVVLRCLSRGEMYGYELAQAVHALTDGALEVREGLLYPLLHSQTVAGHVTRRRETVDGRPRVYYRLTPKGRRHLEGLRAEWSRVVQAVGRALG
jgi:PadR family transcriptional regulator, regulatory protein PadR